MLEHSERALRALKRLQEDERSRLRGLCWHLGANASYEFYRAVCDSFTRIMATWPRFSGDYLFPVPHPYMTPEHAFECCRHRDSFWLGEYGENRLQLLNHSILMIEEGAREYAKNGDRESREPDDIGFKFCLHPWI